MKLKILLLVILLALIPQTNAAVFINQTVFDTWINVPVPDSWLGQTFTTPNYPNVSVYRLDYIEFLGKGNGAPSTVTANISNATYKSQYVSITAPNIERAQRINFTDVYLNKNSLYWFNITAVGDTRVYASLGGVNPYAGGRCFDAGGLCDALSDLTFNISLSPHDNVGNWTMNQGTGNYANDSSEFFNNGTLAGVSIPTWTTNLINGSVNSTALQLGGRGNVNITTNETLNFTQEMSFFGWIKPADLTAYDPIVIIAKDDSNTKRSWALRLNGGVGTLSAFVVDNTGASHSASNGAVTKDTWQYIGFTVNSSGQIINLYINNAVVATQTFPATNTIKVTDTNVSIGSPSNNFFDQFYFNGTVDEFKMYNYVLNQSEITALYQQFQPVPAYPVGGLLISPTSAITTVNFVWHDTVYPQDEIIIATDSGFTNVVHDAFHSTDTASVTLPVNQIYYWKVRQFNAGTGSYGNTSAIQTFTLGTVPTFIRVNVFDELNLSSVPNINVTLISTATNTSVNFSSTGTNNWINATNPSITDGVEYLAQIGAIGYTTRNILISAPGNYSVYLPYTATAAGVSQINFVESDYTSLFPFLSTKLIVTKIINTSVVNISSNHFDATGVSTVQLINGQQYQLTVESSLSTRSLGSYIPTASATQTLLVGSFTLQPGTAYNGLLFNFTYNTNQSIVLQWSDPNTELITLNETIINQQGTLVYQLITSVHSGQTTYLLTNVSSKYLVQLNISTVHNGFLLYSLWYNPTIFNTVNLYEAPQPAPNNFVIAFGNASNLSTTSNANVPISQTVKNYISMGFLLVMLLVINETHSKRYLPVISLFSLIFWLSGMLVFGSPIGFIGTGAILGVVFVFTIFNLLTENNRGT